MAVRACVPRACRATSRSATAEPRACFRGRHRYNVGRVRILKWISWGLAGLVVLLLLSIAVVVWVVDPNAFKPRIEAEVRKVTGREFTLKGDIELGFFPWLALRTGAGSF